MKKISISKNNAIAYSGFFFLVRHILCKTAERVVQIRACGYWVWLVVFAGILNGVQVSAAVDNRVVAYRVNIPAQSVASALTLLSEQTSVQVLFTHNLVKDRQANAVFGTFTLQQAISKLLRGTGISGGLSNKGVLTISLGESKASNNQGEVSMNMKRNVLAAAVGAFLSGGSWAQDNVASGEWEFLLEEIVVTAQKRKASLQDTAMSISTITKEEIEQKSLVSFDDYIRYVPGVSLHNSNLSNQIIVRGLATSPFEQATVATYLGEVPLTSPIQLGAVNDAKLVDMERVEVLRGPQGTLFGSGSLGGAVRNIPAAPSFDGVEGVLDIGFGAMAHSNDPSNKVVGVLNLPLLDDTLALRTAVYRFDKGGYIDLVSNSTIEGHAETVGTTVRLADDRGGQAIYSGIRASLLWQPSERMSATLMLGTQEQEVKVPSTFVTRDTGKYVFSSLNYDQQPTSNEFDFANLVVEYDLDWASITAVITDIDGENLIDLDGSYFGLLTKTVQETNKEGSTQELRLSSVGNGPFQYLFGIYHEEYDGVQTNNSDWIGDPEVIEGLGRINPRRRITINGDVEQTAFFGEMSYSVNSSWNLTVGGRWYDFDREDSTLFLNGPTGVVINDGTALSTNEQDSLFKTNVSYTPTDDIHLYAQWSQGFRLGQGQSLPDSETCDVDGDGILDTTNARLDPEVASDGTDNFELGGKFAFLDDRLMLNATIFQVDWTDIPVFVFETSDLCNGTANSRITANGGEAQSKGVELDGHYFLTQNLKVSLSLAYVDAKLTSDSSAGESGDRLPLSPRVNGSVGVRYDFDMSGYDTFMRADYSYVGDYSGRLNSDQVAGDFGKFDMRAGITLNQFNIELYGTNLIGEDELTRSSGFSSDTSAVRLAPRTLGIDVRYAF